MVESYLTVCLAGLAKGVVVGEAASVAERHLESSPFVWYEEEGGDEEEGSPLVTGEEEDSGEGAPAAGAREEEEEPFLNMQGRLPPSPLRRFLLLLLLLFGRVMELLLRLPFSAWELSMSGALRGSTLGIQELV